MNWQKQSTCKWEFFHLLGFFFAIQTPVGKQSQKLPKNISAKGHLISECLFGVFTFFQKRMKKSRQVVMLNLFVHFLEETTA